MAQGSQRRKTEKERIAGGARDRYFNEDDEVHEYDRKAGRLITRKPWAIKPQ